MAKTEVESMYVQHMQGMLLCTDMPGRLLLKEEEEE